MYQDINRHDEQLQPIIDILKHNKSEPGKFTTLDYASPFSIIELMASIEVKYIRYEYIVILKTVITSRDSD